MGRMLDTLKQAQTRRGKDGPALHAVWPENKDEDETPAEDMPFIEVGGPRTPAETPTEPTASIAKLMTVTFRPFAPVISGGRGGCAFAPEVVAYHQPRHAISEQYRGVVDGLLAVLSDKPPRVLLFAASVPGAGTTTVLLNAAVTAARQAGRRVVVVDAHLRRPALAARLGLPEKPGLREVLAGRLKLEEAVRPTGLDQLSTLAAGDADAASPVRLAGENMRAVLRQLREQFDLVLVDGPCWDGRPEVVALGCACDAVCLCLPEAEQHTPKTAELLQIVPEQGAVLCGCILTSR